MRSNMPYISPLTNVCDNLLGMLQTRTSILMQNANLMQAVLAGLTLEGQPLHGFRDQKTLS